MNPRFPIYIISKGRWERRQTVKTLESMNCPFKIVVEPSEYDNYKEHIDIEKIICLPSNLSELKQGSIPVRNFVWQHSIDAGFEFHWILDDNIESVERFYNNMKIKCICPTPFAVIEDFVLRYENIAMAGMNYGIFCPATEGRQPIRFNERIYSCILIKNDIEYRWRGRYNEDTDLSLRVLKDGYCTIQFNAFLQGKVTTQRMKGGNTKEFYREEGTMAKSQMLVDLHPDVAKVVWRFNRWHHHVDYRQFKHNRLKKREGLSIPDRVNNYGMKLVEYPEWREGL